MQPQQLLTLMIMEAQQGKFINFIQIENYKKSFINFPLLNNREIIVLKDIHTKSCVKVLNRKKDSLQQQPVATNAFLWFDDSKYVTFSTFFLLELHFD